MVQNEKIYIPEAQVEKLLSQSGSELEAKWVRFLANRDQQQSECLEALGFTVIRFPQEEDWERIVQEYPALFGRIDL
jgi:very-short-patch-repair endonuclease